jgi:transposase-like protein
MTHSDADYDLAVFVDAGEHAKARLLDGLNRLFAETLATEQRAAAEEAQRAELERQRAELEAERAELAKARAELKAAGVTPH